MAIGRWIGWILLGAALVSLGWDAVRSVQESSLIVSPLGEQWYRIDAASLGLTQAVVQRYVWPPLWDPGITTVLLWPGWLVLGIPGALLSWFCRVRRRNTWFI